MKKFMKSKLRQNELDKALNALTPEVSSEEEFIPEVEVIPEEKPKIFPPLPLEPPLPGNPPLPLETTLPGHPPIIKQDIIIEQEYKQESEPVKSFQEELPKAVSVTKPQPSLNALTPEMSSEEEFIPEVEFIQEEEFIPEEKPIIFPPLTFEPPLPGNPPLPLKPPLPGNTPFIKQDIIEREYKQESEPAISFQEEISKVVSATQPGSTPIVCKEYMLRRDCKRIHCKQTHIDNPTEEQMRTAIRFCHDFQNKKCLNPNCRYIHGTKEEEKHIFWIRTQNASKGENIENAVPVTYMQEEQLLVPIVPPPVLEHKPIICRTYHLRGSCSRISCKHHHVDHPTMEQVHSAFVFCQNFQRSECWIPNCTLLHATTVEEMRFYRTRELPLSCMSKVSSIIQEDIIREYENTMVRKTPVSSFQEVPPPIPEPKSVICRSYHLCGECRRGSTCQYLHIDSPTVSQVRAAFEFCYYYQFRVCYEKSCKDIHATFQEELIFFKTRKLPPYVASSIIKQETIQKYEEDAAPKAESIVAMKLEPTSVVCYSYLRDICIRQTHCKYRHENNPTEKNLRDAFPFCRNFQNRKCLFENCQYIHATTFEELHFYRTKELPPHVFSHIRNKEVKFGPAFLFPVRIKYIEKIAAFEEANAKIAFVLRKLLKPVSKAWGKDVDQEVAALLAKWDRVVTS